MLPSEEEGATAAMAGADTETADGELGALSSAGDAAAAATTTGSAACVVDCEVQAIDHSGHREPMSWLRCALCSAAAAADLCVHRPLRRRSASTHDDSGSAEVKLQSMLERG